MHALEVSTQEIAGVGLCVRLVGTLDSKTVNIFEEAMKVVRRDRKSRLILDLSEVGFVSSAGVGVILDTWDWTRQNAGNVVVLGAVKAVREVFDTLGLSSLVTLSDDLPSAVKTLQQ